MILGVSKRFLVIVAVIVGLPAGILLFWSVQAGSMKRDFVQALRSGKIDGVPLNLQDKVWTEEELSLVTVIKVTQGAGKERSIERLIHERGRVIVPSAEYAYQAIMKDTSTGTQHAFGYLRGDPDGWRWITVVMDRAAAEKWVDERIRTPGSGSENSAP